MPIAGGRCAARQGCEAAELAISADLGEIMDRWPDRSDATTYHRELQMVVDRPAARFAAWYEIFVRSQGTAAGRSATFREAETRLPAIASMGFDTLYMTPIHPIGTPIARARTTAWSPAPNDPGSPYAIGVGSRRARGGGSRAGHARRFSAFSAGRTQLEGWSWRWTSPSIARPITLGQRAPRLVLSSP